MRHGRSVLVSVAAACAFAPATSTFAAGSADPPSVHRADASEASADGPTIVRGVAPDGATIKAYARADKLVEGEEVETLELPVTVDSDASRFEVHADPSALTSTFITDGYVDVQVMAQSPGGGVWVTHTSARAVQSGADLAWADPISPVRPGAPFARLKAGFGDAGVDVGRLTPVAAAPTADDAEQRSECLVTVINSRWVKARIGSTYPAGRSKAWLDVDHSDGGEYQVAMKVPGHPIQKMEMQRVKGGWGVETAHVSSAKNYLTDVLYDVVDNRYVALDGTCRYYLTFEPQKESGGMYVRKAKRPDYGNCVSVSSGVIWKRIVDDGRPYQLSYGVNLSAVFYGVDLAVEKNYGPSHHVLKYRVVGAGHRMCGSNDTPATASIVMERRG